MDYTYIILFVVIFILSKVFGKKKDEDDDEVQNNQQQGSEPEPAYTDVLAEIRRKIEERTQQPVQSTRAYQSEIKPITVFKAPKVREFVRKEPKVSAHKQKMDHSRLEKMRQYYEKQAAKKSSGMKGYATGQYTQSTVAVVGGRTHPYKPVLQKVFRNTPDLQKAIVVNELLGKPKAYQNYT